MTLADRLWARVDKSGNCWVWGGYCDDNGYGHIGAGGQHGGTILVHRAAWMVTLGAIPDGMKVLHNCDNPPCVRLTHLFLGTQADNIEDMIRKGRKAPPLRGEAGTATKLTSETVAIIRSSSLSERKLAARFGVSHTSIGAIRRGETWRYE